MSSKSDETILFFRQFGEMLRCGVPVVPALDVFARDGKNTMAPLAQSLARQIERGNSLSRALQNEQRYIPDTLIVLIQIGERTGRIAESMVQATDWLKADRDLVKKVWGSLTYPLLVFAVSCLLALSLFTTVIPKLMDVMSGLGAELPWPTKVVSAISSAVCEPFFWLVAASLVCLFAYEMTIPEVRKKVVNRVLRFLLKLPVTGTTLESYYFVRFCNGLGLLVENGVSVLQAVAMAQKLSAHPDLLEDQADFRQRVEGGQSLTEAMSERRDIYPSMVVSFVSLGEESATLSLSMMRAAQLQDLILQDRLEAFRQALEPIMTVGVGILVAGVLVATMLPLYSIVSSF